MKNLELDLSSIESDALNEILKKFYAEVRQKNGSIYSKAGLINIRAGLQRLITSQPYNRNMNLMKDREFNQANYVIQGQIKKLREEGKDKSKHKEPIEPTDYVKIMNSLDLNTPQGLQNKVFLDVLKHYGRRGVEGLRQLKRDSFVICTDSSAGHRTEKP